MLTIAYYFFQVVLCSSIMMGYYWIVLRNKKFHQYNRFYLLFAAIASWIIPLVKINITQPAIKEPQPILNLVNIVADNNSEMEHILIQKGFAINWDAVIISLYVTISIVFFVSILAALFRIYQLLKKHSCKNVDDIYLILTNAKGTPFSFFKYIFWNDAVDMNTHTGKQMMQHELTHVREHHSIDKIFIQVVMMFGWFNPFFWLLKKELHLIHEFIADNKTIKDGDAASLANMLLAAAYPQQNFLLTNPFFFSPIKRRLLMLTNTKNAKLSYVRRVLALPLLSVVVLLFAFRKKDADVNKAPLNKVYTVVIDAGHGGEDAGAAGLDGSKEKDLALLMLKAIKENNKNENIHLVFTRENDVFQNPIEKAKFVNDNKADLFISLHMNWATKEEGNKSGVEIFVPLNDGKRSNVEKSKLFASAIEQSILKSFSSNGVKTRSKGVWILKATNCPAALIECGFLSNEKDLASLKNKDKQNEMAKLILEGVENYLHNNDVAKVMDNAKIAEVSNIDKQVGEQLHRATVVAIKEAPDKIIITDTFSTDTPIERGTDLKKCLYFIDGKKVKYEDLDKEASPNDFKTVSVIKKKEQLAAYGDEGKYGVVLITTKKKSVAFDASAIPITFLSPLNNSHITQGFGKYYVDNNSRFESYNDGLTISSKNDNHVKSVAEGVVTSVINVGGEIAIIVKINDMFITYFGLNDVSVEKGEAMHVGTLIGEASVKDGEYTVLLMVADSKGKFIDPTNLLASK